MALMRNFCGEGDTVSFTVTDTTGVQSGEGVMVGSNLFGIACFDAGPGDVCEAQLVGVFELPKDSSDISAGDKVYWSGSAASGSGSTVIGAAVADAGTSDSTVKGSIE